MNAIGQAMIETRELRKTFKSRRSEVEAVRGVDLRIEAGEIFGFLGPNGAGKTTTLRMLATLLPPTAGEATVAGVDLRRDPQEVRRRIGYVPQGGSTDPAMTGRGELVLQGRLYGMSRTDARRRAGEVLATLDLETAADRATGSYSGGMRRRLDVGLGPVVAPGLGASAEVSLMVADLVGDMDWDTASAAGRARGWCGRSANISS